MGLLAGVLYVWGSGALIAIKIDDAVDAVPVHCLGGIWGMLAVGLLSHPDRLRKAFGSGDHPGLFYSFSNGGADGNLLACQIIGCLFVIGWTLFTMLPFFLWLNFMGWFRSGSIQELVGLDVTYNLDGGVGLVGEEKEENEEAAYLDAYERYKQNMKKNREGVVAHQP